MHFIDFTKKALRFTIRKFFFIVFQYPRFFKYRLLSNHTNVIGKPKCYQPIQINGKGNVIFYKNVRLGVDPSPYLYSGYIYIDARKLNSTIKFGKNTWINNNCTFISDGAGIEIGENTLIGTCCEIIDSDFHDTSSTTRAGGIVKAASVIIGNNVFIGSNVKILKGVYIGDNSVIANGSIVTKSIPSNVIAAGVPAKKISDLKND